MLQKLIQTPKLNKVAKIAAPLLSKALIRRPFSSGLLLLEIYLAILQGKGAGAGWDMDSEVDVALKHIRRTDAVIFDVGANDGKWSADLLKKSAQDHWRIFQFEPTPLCLEKLRELNLPRTTIIPAAVGAQPGTVSFYIYEGSLLNTLFVRKDSISEKQSFSSLEVTMTTIDATIAQYDLNVIDYLKMDIEGSELSAFHGARQAFEEKRIKAVAFEFGGANLNAHIFFRELWDFLNDYGYSINRICPGSVLMPIRAYDETLEYFRGATNYLAMAPSC